MQKDLISVIIPAYGHETFVENTIRSIINQTYENTELIILNDGSPDNTAEVIESLRAECEKRFTRFVFIDKENEGVIKTMNRGLKESKGSYIVSIGSDDQYEPEALEILHGFLSQNPDYGIVVCDNFIMDDDGKRCFWDANRKNVYNENEAAYKTFGEFLQKIRPDVNFNSNEFGSYKSLLKDNYIPNGYMTRKEIFVDKVGGYTEKLKLEDHYFMIQVAKYTKFKYIDKPLFSYRWHANNTVKKEGWLIGEGAKLVALEKEYAAKHGFLKELYKTKRIGIPFLLEFERRLTENGKEKRLKLFGITLYKKIKN